MNEYDDSNDQHDDDDDDNDDDNDVDYEEEEDYKEALKVYWNSWDTSPKPWSLSSPEDTLFPLKIFWVTLRTPLPTLGPSVPLKTPHSHLRSFG